MGSEQGRRHVFSAVTVNVSKDEWVRYFLLSALLGLSWWSTTQGLISLITATNGNPGNAVIITIGFAVGILTLLISWTLDQIRSGATGILMPLFIMGYCLLTVISVGFGYGFYWKHIESHGAAQRAAEAETELLTRQLTSVFARLDEATSALDEVARVSSVRAQTEKEIGGTCGAGNLAGPGPRFRLRTDDAATMSTLQSRISAQLGGTENSSSNNLYTQRAQMEQQLERLTPKEFAKLEEEQVRRLLKDTEQMMGETAAFYEAFRSGPSVHYAVQTLKDRILTGQGTIVLDGYRFTCPDRELEIIMSQAVTALESLPELPPIELEVPLGPEATVAAFGKFANTMLYPLRRDDNASLMEGRDYIPLGVATAIDLFILLLSLYGVSAMHSGRTPPGTQLLDRPDFVHHFLGQTEQKQSPAHLELLKFSFWWEGSYYLAVPLRPMPMNEVKESLQRLSFAAMVLADGGYLIPLSPTYRSGQWLDKVFERLGTHAAGHLTMSDFDLYRYKKSSLARMASMLSHGTTAQDSKGLYTAEAIAKQIRKTDQSTKPVHERRDAGLMSRGHMWGKGRGLMLTKKK